MKKKTSNLYADIGYMSLTHAGEEICGDHVDVVKQGEDSTVIVMADGLGSGVKAGILSTLTSKIISTMLAEGMKLEDAVETIAATLPICSVRGIGYSTFTIIRIVNNERAEIIRYDDPKVVLLRNGTNVEVPYTMMGIGDKKIYRADVNLEENDIFVAFSDGVTHAGVGRLNDFGWGRRGVIDFMETYCDVGFTAKTLTTMLLDEVSEMYDGEPGDDATACVIRIRQKVPMNLMVGPPANRSDSRKMMSLFFSKKGKHIVCGGTTSTIAAEFLNKPLIPELKFPDPDIPPIAKLEGVDLVTEGVITINRVVEYAKDYLKDNKSYEIWSFKKDGASQIARLLFEEATDINFFVGRAINPAHQNPNLPINFNIKMHLVEELASCLTEMGKKIKINYF